MVSRGRLMRVKWMISMAVKALMCSCGQACADGPAHVQVVVERQRRVQPADDVDLGRPRVGGLAGPGDDLVDAQLVAAARLAVRSPVAVQRSTALGFARLGYGR